MVTWSRVLIGIAVALVVLVGAAVLYWPKFYYGERDQILAQFAKIPGITNVKVFGNEDISYEIFSVAFQLVGRPDATVTIGFRDDDFGLTKSPKNFAILTLGSWVIRTKEHVYNVYDQTGKKMRSWGYGTGADVGPEGRFSALLPFKLKNVQDVISHYDELNQLFSTWPTINQPGQLTGLKNQLTGANDDTLEYYCAQADAKGWPESWKNEIQSPQRVERDNPQAR